jgi:hypothetical protein
MLLNGTFPALPARANVSSNTTLTIEEVVYASGTITITLQSAVTWKRRVTIKNVGTGTVTVVGPSGQTIDALSTLAINNPNAAYTLEPDGANWQVVPAYEPLPSWLTITPQWDKQWRAALRGSATGAASVCVMGDSFTQGNPDCTNYMTKTYFALLRTGLIAKYAHAGDFYPPQYSSEYYVFQSLTFSGTPPLSSMNATNRNFVSGGFGWQVYWNPNPGAGNLVTFTTQYACTDVDIITCDYATGTWTYTVDGGAPVTVTVPATPDGNTIRRTQITGLSNAVHTIVVTGQSAANVFMLFGFASYKSRTVGLKFGWTALCGAAAINYVNGLAPAYGIDLVWQGKSGASLTGFGFPAQPDLAIIALGINDCANGGFGMGPNGYKGAIRRVCDALRRGNPNCSLLFVAHNNPSGNNSDVVVPFANARSWPTFIEQMTSIVYSYNGALLNMHAKWGMTGITQGFQTGTDAHPNDVGHQDIADQLKVLL